MLVELPVKAGDIVVVKVDGMEVIGKLDNTNDKAISLRKPLAVNLIMGPNGQAGVAMIPWLVTADDTRNIIISKEKVTVITTARKEARDQYIQQTTGLAVSSIVPANVVPGAR